MPSKKEFKLVKESLSKIPKEDLIRFILEHGQVSKKELLDLKQQALEQVPLTIFTTKLSPLEAVTRFMREKTKKRTNEIASILNKRPSSISEAYRNLKAKKFRIKEFKIKEFRAKGSKIKKTDIFIPLSEFQHHPKLSILEVVVNYLRKENFPFTKIAKLLKRNPKTIWTVYQRAKKKNASIK